MTPPRPKARHRRLPTTLCNGPHITTSGCSKPPWGLLFPSEVRGIFTTKQVHSATLRDSGNLVTSLVQVGIQPTRYYATMRASELGPLFTSPSTGWTRVWGTGSEQKSAPIRTIAGLQGPVFLTNSRTPLVIETYRLHDRHPLFRSYRAILPNSLKSVLRIRLSLLNQGTFLGSRYDHDQSLSRGFSWVLGLGETLRLLAV